MPHARSIERLIDEQVNRWRILGQKAEKKPELYQPVVSISREAGSLGKEVAARVAQSLGVALFDREIIEAVAKSAHLSTRVVETLDERGRMALDEWLLVTVSGGHIVPDQYIEHLIKVVGAIGKHGHAVILGRGVGFLLPREHCFRVRCVAPLDFRVANWAREVGLSEADARRQVEQTDRERRAFIARHFRADWTDAVHYDVIVNTATLGVEGAAETIVAALRQTRGAGGR